MRNFYLLLLLTCAICLADMSFAQEPPTNQVQGGIFDVGSGVLSVKVKPSVNFQDSLFSQFLVTIKWETSYGVTLGNPSSTYGIAKQGSVFQCGPFSYQKFGGTPNAFINWIADSAYQIFAVPVSGGDGSGTFCLGGDSCTAANSGEFFVEINGRDKTNSAFYQGCVAGVALPIQMASFAANLVRDKEVEVVWRTVSETNNYGFEVYRKRGEAGSWTKMGFVEGHGTTLAPQSYSYTDRSVSFGKYFYRIKQLDLDGKSETFPEMEVNVGVGPGKFVVTQNYPNPFNPSTNIDFTVPQDGFTSLKVFNVLGQEVATLFEGNAETGKVYTARFSASSLASGLYFYRLRSAGKLETRRMLLLK